MAYFELSYDLSSQALKSVTLLFTELPRRLIDDAKCSEILAVWRDERSACIETDVWLSGDKRVCKKPLVFRGVENLKQVSTQNGVRTERDVSRHLTELQSYGAFEPLPLFIYEGD
jgi:hypothetical protein